LDYCPVKRENRLIRAPIIKSAAGAGLTVVSDSEKSIYRETEEEMRKEGINKKDTL
jgi:hypothetical protein